MNQAIEIYRAEFAPSKQLDKPYVILGYNICAADSEEEARYLRTSSLQAFLNLRFGNPGQLPPPIKDFENTLNAQQKQVLDQVSSCSAVGTPQQIRADVEKFVLKTGADELIIVAQIFDHQARLKSYSLAYEACQDL